MEETIDFHRDLNQEQLQAVETLDGPVLVIAGAGSGKTRTLVYRVAKLIQSGVDPENILLLTFTRKAASTMLERAARLVGNSCNRVTGGTFHGFAYSMLKRYGHLLGYPQNFTVIDRSDVQSILGLLLRELDLASHSNRFPKKNSLATIINRVQNFQGDLAQVLEREYPHLLSEFEGLKLLFDAYERYKKKHALMDYDDLLLNWKRVLEENEQVRRQMGAHFQFIMVDEYQDTNRPQAEIVRYMATGHDNVMVVGDDAQSIYSFRGADFKNILRFPELFPGTRIIKLEKNYRSTQPNLDCTNAIIAQAREKFSKRLVAQRSGGHPPLLYQARDEGDQAFFVANRIEELVKEGVPSSEIAVLFRASFHSFQLEAELQRRNIPFVKRGGLKLLESAHTKDLLSLLRILINPRDRLSWTRVLLLIDRLGPKSADKITASILTEEDPFETLVQYKSRAVWKKSVEELGLFLRGLQESDFNLKEIMVRLKEWYDPFLKAKYFADYPRRKQELEQLVAIADRYDDGVTLLSELAIDPPGQEDVQSRDDCVTLSTIHSAKGLEWQVVFIISLAEGRFPVVMASRCSNELEEERRLFYVAATRAKDLLVFTYPAFINVGNSGMIPAKPSPLLEEIPLSLMKLWNQPNQSSSGRSRRHKIDADIVHEPDMSAAKATRSAADRFQRGARIRHPIFGPGHILERISQEKIRVLFDVGGEKTLHLEYAKLSLIG